MNIENLFFKKDAPLPDAKTLKKFRFMTCVALALGLAALAISLSLSFYDKSGLHFHQRIIGTIQPLGLIFFASANWFLTTTQSSKEQTQRRIIGLILFVISMTFTGLSFWLMALYY